MQYSMEFDMPDEEINAFISYIGKANKCDRFYIFEDSLTENITVNTYEYCAPCIQSEKDNLQRVDKEALKEHYAFFAKGQSIVIPSVAALKDVNPALYDCCSPNIPKEINWLLWCGQSQYRRKRRDKNFLIHGLRLYCFSTKAPGCF